MSRNSGARRRYLRKKANAIPTVFTPRFWDAADHRLSTIKEIRDRYELLKRDSGADSAQKDILVRRATFLSVRCETMEVVASEGGSFDAGVYASLVNTLLGVLRSLGLGRKAKVESLQSYLKQKAGNKGA